MHRTNIVEIYSHAFLAKISWKQHVYCKQITKELIWRKKFRDFLSFCQKFRVSKIFTKQLTKSLTKYFFQFFHTYSGPNLSIHFTVFEHNKQNKIIICIHTYLWYQPIYELKNRHRFINSLFNKSSMLFFEIEKIFTQDKHIFMQNWICRIGIFQENIKCFFIHRFSYPILNGWCCRNILRELVTRYKKFINCVEFLNWHLSEVFGRLIRVDAWI